MSNTVSRTYPTVAETREQWEKAEEFLARLTFVESATIEDYPIGGANRGLCKLEVEHTPKKGYRSVRTTTDKHGRWCKPKKSTFRDHPMVVVQTNGEAERDTAWLMMGGSYGPYLQFANGKADEPLCKPPCTGKPRREPSPYRITTNGVVEHRSLPADPPELCDAWEEWYTGYVTLAKRIIAFRQALVTVEA